ncbi:hypothetical protein D9758_005011 [Tetrapyrgos nigripes]|uniref:Uncharacterized protein n=1 Tax=Tetrapyrgos nigripes TaxID=182062 RepID=A0A8H5GW30_9AGAR|nr:hypothetical protein D9758_005011 [Tetrapyrgos nigripes]
MYIPNVAVATHRVIWSWWNWASGNPKEESDDSIDEDPVGRAPASALIVVEDVQGSVLGEWGWGTRGKESDRKKARERGEEREKDEANVFILYICMDPSV